MFFKTYFYIKDLEGVLFFSVLVLVILKQHAKYNFTIYSWKKEFGTFSWKKIIQVVLWNQQRLWILSRSQETMFPTLFLGHSVQDVSYVVHYLSHNSLWFKVLGALFTGGRLGFSWENSDHSLSTHHPMQVENIPTHVSCRVWCPTLLAWDYFLLGFTYALH